MIGAARAPLAGKRIGLLTASASRLGGGVYEAVARQAELIRELGALPIVLALRDVHSSDDAHRLHACEVHHATTIGPAAIGFAPSLAGLLDGARLDLLHLHGIWMFPSQAASAWAARHGKPYLISPHGMLDPWITGRGRWKKALARAGYERRSWRRATAFHALTSDEAEDIARESGQADALVIANPSPPPSPLRAAMPRPHIVYLGRIHPKKNIAALIDGWAILDQAGGLPPDARLIIAGWGEPADVAAIKARLATAPESVQFVGPQFGAAKAALLAKARYLVLPSLSEGLPMTVLEAWAAGTPTIMSRECHMPIGFAEGAALECAHGADAIATALGHALKLEQTAWFAMTNAALRLASGPFAATTIARQWEAAYADLIGEV